MDSLILIEDNISDQIYLKVLLSKTKYKSCDLKVFASIKEVLNSEDEWKGISSDTASKIILLDLSLPDSSGFNSFLLVSKNFPNTPILILTGIDDVELAHDLIKLGAQDYLIKEEINERLLEKSIDYARERHLLKIQQIKFNDRLVESILEAQESERKRIAKEMHDGIVQSLTALSLRLNTLKDTIGESHIESFDKCVNDLSGTIDEIRDISHSLMPRTVAEHGLCSALEGLIQDIQLGTEISFELLMTLTKEPDERLKLAIYRIVQELINNSIKHSQADRMLVQLIEYEDVISLMVEDNGIGFEKQNVLKDKNCFGLHSIESRVHSIGGEIELDSRPGEGTNTSIMFPKNFV